MLDRQSSREPSDIRNVTRILLTLFAWFAFVAAVTISICGVFRTFVVRVTDDHVLSVSRNGASLVLYPTVLAKREVDEPRIKFRTPHPDDAGLFFGTVNQQFIPSFHIPGFHIISGGWGVSEQGTIMFVAADATSTAIVASRLFLLTITIVLNVALFIVFRHSSTLTTASTTCVKDADCGCDGRITK